MPSYIFRAVILSVILIACVVESTQAQHFKKSGRTAKPVSSKHWWNSKKPLFGRKRNHSHSHRTAQRQQQIRVAEPVEPETKHALTNVPAPPPPKEVEPVIKQQPVKQAAGFARMPSQTRQTAGYARMPSVRMISQQATTPPVPIGPRYQPPTGPITSIGGINNNGTGTVQLDAPMYPSPQPNIPYQVGGSMITNQAFAPHEMLYPHKYKAVYPPFYYKVHGKWMVTPFGVWSHDTWVLEGTEVEVNYKSKLGLSSKLGVFSGWSQPGRH